MRRFFVQALIFVFASGIPFVASAENHFARPQLSRVSCDYIGNIKINGAPADPGDEVAFFDPQGVICGFYQVLHRGEFGVMHVYGDDPLSLETDEGAEPGDILEIRLWDQSESVEIAGFSIKVSAGSPVPGSVYQSSFVPPIWENQKAFALNIDTRQQSEKPMPSPLVCNFIGHITINGKSASTGDEIIVYDPDNNMCGHTRLSSTGQYGILQVYGDDERTTDQDEGAKQDEELSFAVYDSLNRVWLDSTYIQFSKSQALGSFTPSNHPPVWQAAQAYVLDMSVSYQYQNISLSPAYGTQKANQPFTLTVLYTTGDLQAHLNSIGINIHFDGSRFAFQDLKNIFQKGFVQFNSTPQKDDQDLDLNPFTDQYIQMQWSDSSWPDRELPLKLADMTFFTLKTARPGASDIGISFIAHDQNYKTSKSPATIVIDNPPATLYGQVSYSGTAEGTFFIGAWKSTDWHQWQDTAPERICASVNGKYMLRLIPDQYIIGAFRDHDENSSYLSFHFDKKEPFGFYTASQLISDQNKRPEHMNLESSDIRQENFNIYDWPVIDQMMIKNEYFAEHAIFAQGKALFALTTVYYRPLLESIQSVRLSHPLISSPHILKDDGLLPDLFSEDRTFTMRTSILPSETEQPYTFQAVANDLIVYASYSLTPTYIEPPIIENPKEITTANPVFKWQPIPGIEIYGIHIFSTDKPQFLTHRIYSKTVSASNQYQLTSEELNITENVRYYFYITAETKDRLSISYSDTKYFVIDTQPPEITQVVFSPESPVKAGPLDITITYNEKVNTDIEPEIRLKNMEIYFSGSYTSEQTWHGQCSVPEGQNGYKVLQVFNVNDIAGNVMPENTSFSVTLDTKKPEVISVLPNKPVKEGNVDFTICFNEPMNTSKVPLASFGDPAKAVTLSYISDIICTGAYQITKGYDGSQTIRISNGFDKANNQMDLDQTHSFTVDTTAPSAPTELSASQVGLSLQLTWQTNTESDIGAYQVYQDGKKRNKISHPGNKHTELMISGKTYVFHVTAIDKLGHESLLSKPFYITTHSIPPVITLPVNGQILVEPATIVKGKAEFASKIQIYINAATAANHAYANSKGEFTISDIPLVKGINDISASSINANDVASSESYPITVIYDPKPEAPQGLIATSGDTTIVLQWEGNSESDIKGYHVYRFNKRYNETLLEETRFSDMLLTNGMPYVYHVSAVDLHGSEGAKSEPIWVTPTAGIKW